MLKFKLEPFSINLTIATYVSKSGSREQEVGIREYDLPPNPYFLSIRQEMVDFFTTG